MRQGIRRFINLLVAICANVYYGFPSRKLRVIGVTGTDGKTTTANLIYDILSAAGIKTGVVSTVNAKIGKRIYDTGLHTTNPESFPLQRLLFQMVKEKCEYVVLEVTSHGLYQYRNFGIHFDVAVLTNITHEHLDYHKTFKNYVKAKAMLFNQAKISIVNKKYGPLLKKYVNKEKEFILYDNETLKGALGELIARKFREPFNRMNSTAAILVARTLGVKEKYIASGVKHFKGVEGRMQEVPNKRGIRVVVDFAHTPNALENVLSALKEQTHKGKKLIAVFGCPGERDVQKRPMMARASTDIADVSIFTADDPRHEKVGDIFEQMSKGVKNKKAVIYKIPDRFEAISFAINKIAKRGDTVGLCGKGHEKSMAYANIERPWSDAKVAAKILRNRTDMPRGV